MRVNLPMLLFPHLSLYGREAIVENFDVSPLNMRGKKKIWIGCISSRRIVENGNGYFFEKKLICLFALKFKNVLYYIEVSIEVVWGETIYKIWVIFFKRFRSYC